MKVVKQVEAPCPCTTKLWEYYEQDAGCCWGVGTVVECDCGAQYTLSESQRDGRFWIKRTPTKAGVYLA